MFDSPVFNHSTSMLLNKFDDHSHLFVYAFKQSYSMVSGYTNSLYDSEIFDIKKINEYLKLGDYIVLHGLRYTKQELSALDPNISSRIVWCVWGSDLYNFSNGAGRLKYCTISIARFVYWNLIKRKVFRNYLKCVSNFKGIFVGFNRDSDLIQRRYSKKLNVYNALYPSGYYIDDVNNALEYQKGSLYESKNKNIQVLLGHSASPFLNHIKNLKKLK